MFSLEGLHYEICAMKAKNVRRKNMLENQKGDERTTEYLARVAKNYSITEVAIYKCELALSLLKEVKQLREAV